MNLSRRLRNVRRVLLAIAVRRSLLRHCRPRLRLTALRLGRLRWRAALTAVNLLRRRRKGRRVLLATAVRRRHLRHICLRPCLTALLRRRWRLSTRRLVGLGRRRRRAALTAVNLPRRRRNGCRVLLATAVRRRHFRHVRPRLCLTALRLRRRRWRAKAVGYFSRVNTSCGARE